MGGLAIGLTLSVALGVAIGIVMVFTLSTSSDDGGATVQPSQGFTVTPSATASVSVIPVPTVPAETDDGSLPFLVVGFPETLAVPFNKEFSVPPTVMTTVEGNFGTMGPSGVVSNVTTTGFDVSPVWATGPLISPGNVAVSMNVTNSPASAIAWSEDQLFVVWGGIGGAGQIPGTDLEVNIGSDPVDGSFGANSLVLQAGAQIVDADIITLPSGNTIVAVGSAGSGTNVQSRAPGDAPGTFPTVATGTGLNSASITGILHFIPPDGINVSFVAAEFGSGLRLIESKDDGLTFPQLPPVFDTQLPAPAFISSARSGANIFLAYRTVGSQIRSHYGTDPALFLSGGLPATSQSDATAGAIFLLGGFPCLLYCNSTAGGTLYLTRNSSAAGGGSWSTEEVVVATGTAGTVTKIVPGFLNGFPFVIYTVGTDALFTINDAVDGGGAWLPPFPIASGVSDFALDVIETPQGLSVLMNNSDGTLRYDFVPKDGTIVWEAST